ncbi:MAG: 6-phosphogluconolactonase [Acidimicrobiales bacterium]
MERTWKVDRLGVRAYATSSEMAAAAAHNVGDRLKRLLDRQAAVRAVFAAAASQEAFLDALASESGIDWGRVDVVQLDEYVGLGFADPRSLSRWLAERVADRLGIRHASYMRGDTENLADECARFEAEINARPIDLGLIGIGQNGHLAYNDPHVADFSDPRSVKVVEIDDMSRAQAVRDHAFPTLADVPRKAFTLTMSVLMRIETLSIVVPGAHKAAAVADTLLGPISPACPASSLRRHADATVYVDTDSLEQAESRLGPPEVVALAARTGSR